MHSSRVNKNYAAVHWSFAGNACVCTIPADCMLEQNAHVHCAYERLCGSDKLGIAFFVATFFFFFNAASEATSAAPQSSHTDVTMYARVCV